MHHREFYEHMDTEQRTLRRRLRAHARQLGDRPNARTGEHTIEHLVQETAYEHWHSMLFARFLAENDLLIEPEINVAVTLDECEDLARDKGSDKWELAAQYAHSMLPQVFRTEHPGLEVRLAREYRLKLEGLVEGLPAAVFTATDSLGWVYQFWQTERKNEVNRSEVKIGADELPAVTQLFTEPYMVQFLLHNSLGAWWQTRHPDKRCPVDLTYLRQTEDGAPVAGRFRGLARRSLGVPSARPVLRFWALSGGGVPDAGADADGVGRLECGRGRRCRIARQSAWAGAGPALRGYCRLRAGDGSMALSRCRRPSVAAAIQPCIGAVSRSAVSGNNGLRCPGAIVGLKTGWGCFTTLFRMRPLLGSLIDPTSVSEDMLTAGFSELQPSLERALSKHAGEEEWEETTIAALGLTEATRLLSQQYHLVITNVPYLARGKQSERLRSFAERRYARAKNDLANVFLERCLEFCLEDGAGVTQIVMPQNWLFLTSYKAQRERLLKQVRWNLLVRLGAKAFQTPMWDFNVQLLTLTRARPQTEDQLSGIDASTPRTAAEKADVLRSGEFVAVIQRRQLENPDARVTLYDETTFSLLSQYADGLVGLQTSDDPMFVAAFWEVAQINRKTWEFMQATPDVYTEEYAGQSRMVRWEQGEGLLLSLPTALPTKGLKALGKPGIAVHRMGVLFPYHYGKERFHQNVATIIPHDECHVPAIWCFCSSPEYNEAVRRIDQKLNVTNATLVKVPFDLERWTQVAAEDYPKGLPKPYSDDPTQWIFHGHPCGSVIWDEGTKWTHSRSTRRTDPTVLQAARRPPTRLPLAGGERPGHGTRRRGPCLG